MLSNLFSLKWVFLLLLICLFHSPIFSQSYVPKIRFALKPEFIKMDGLEGNESLGKSIKEGVERRLRKKNCPGQVIYWEEDMLLFENAQKSRAVTKIKVKPNYQVSLTIDLDNTRAQFILVVVDVEKGIPLTSGESVKYGVNASWVSQYTNIEKFIDEAFDQAFSDDNFKYWLKDYEDVYESCYGKPVRKFGDTTGKANSISLPDINSTVTDNSDNNTKEEPPNPFPWKKVSISGGGVAVVGGGVMIGRSVSLYRAYRTHTNPFASIYLDPMHENYLGGFADPASSAIDTREAVRREARKWGYLSLIPMAIGGTAIYLSLADKWPFKNNYARIEPLVSPVESFGLIPGLPQIQYGFAINIK